jgi:hypothetical protein
VICFFADVVVEPIPVAPGLGLFRWIPEAVFEISGAREREYPGKYQPYQYGVFHGMYFSLARVFI